MAASFTGREGSASRRVLYKYGFPIAVLTPKQLEVFLQTEFKRLAQEAGVKGARIHVERATAADYDQVLREVAACLSSAKARVA